MKHRSEIDGLRAVAVLPVLLGHAGFSWFAGGYVGVDVFFVISGFLITGIILSELEEQRFSLVNFYERRARRILPALFLVMFATIPAMWVLASADAMQNFGQSIVATTLFSNNILLTLTSGYWELESAFKPMLHTWSLGVEEQYYVIVPLVLMVLHRFARHHRGTAIAVIGLASFALCLWALSRFPAGNFYQLPTRAWELAAGGVAAGMLRRNPDRDSDVLATLGLVMILGAVLCFGEGLPSPSPYTLVPVIGTVLVLLYCRSGFSRALLASRPMVGVGLISYSTYLWHQPLYAVLRIASPDQPPAWQFALLILASLLLAWLTWRFVENPFRDRKRVSRRVLILTLAPAAALLIGFGLYAHLAGGIPARFEQPPNDEAAGAYKPFNMAVYRLMRDDFTPGAERRLLVLGDSTGRDFVNMAEQAGAFRGWDVVYRDDLPLCDYARLDAMRRALVDHATLVVNVYGHSNAPLCSGSALAASAPLRGKIVFVGPKDFGANLNPVARLPLAERSAARVRMIDEIVEASRQRRANTPPELYVDIIRHLSPDDRTMPIFDETGRILSEDRVHITRPGAAYIGRRIFTDPIWARVIATSLERQRTASPPAP